MNITFMNRDVEINHELNETWGSCLEADSNKTNYFKKKMATSKGNVTEWMIGDMKNNGAFAGGDTTTGIMFFKMYYVFSDSSWSI